MQLSTEVITTKNKQTNKFCIGGDTTLFKEVFDEDLEVPTWT